MKVVSLVIVLLILAAAGASAWQMVDLGVAGSAAAMNRAGVVAGVTAGRVYTWTEAGGVVTYTIPEVKGYLSVSGINDAGVLCGRADVIESGELVGRAYSYDTTTGLFKTYGSGMLAVATAINGLGNVAYYQYTATGVEARMWIASAQRSVPIGQGFIYGVTDDGFATGMAIGSGRPTWWGFYTGMLACPTFPGVEGTGAVYSRGCGTGINSSYLICGYQRSAGGQYHAFVWDPLVDGSLNDIGAGVAAINGGQDTASYASSINDQGEVCGYAIQNYYQKAIYWDSYGNPSWLPVPAGAVTSLAIRISNSGMICGNVYLGGASKAVVWKR